MTSNEILKADLIDILFNNRNKLYGAYMLRKNYDKRLLQSLGMALSLIALLFLFVRTNKTNEVVIESRAPVVIIDLAIPKKIPPIAPPVARTFHAQQQSPQIKYTTPLIVDREPLNKMPDQTDFIHAMISDRTLVGNSDIPVHSDPGPTASVNPNAGVQAPDKPIELIQREPEFPGGTKAWLEFLRNNLRVPEDLEAGEKRTVSIRFQVATDGMITAFEIIKTAGSSYDNEVIRVLKKMPRWKPALRDNVPVARSFTQPVTFIGLEE